MSSLLIRSLVLSAALLLAGASLAQPAVPQHEMELRVAACTTCHGREGRATNSGYSPRLAGKPAVYLFEQLRNFRDGRRRQVYMNGLLANLSDAYLRDMAEYFAALDYPYPQPAPSTLPKALLAQGQSLVVNGDPARGIPSCASCHGESLTGVEAGVPGLLGLPRIYVAAQLGAWRAGQRQALAPDCMAKVARMLSSEDIQAVVGWLDGQAMPRDSRPAAALPDALPMPCSAVGGQP